MKKVMLLDTTSAQFSTAEYVKITCFEENTNEILLIDMPANSYANLFLSCSRVLIKLAGGGEKEVSRSQLFFNKEENIYCIFIL